jgi:hypothetical protein
MKREAVLSVQDSKDQLTKHLKYAHFDVYAYNLSPFVEGNRFFLAAKFTTFILVSNLRLSITQSLNHSLTHSLNYSLTHSLTHSLTLR